MAANTEKNELLKVKGENESSGSKREEYFNKFLGISATLIKVFAFVASATCVQLLERRVPDFELNSIRCFFPLLFCAAGLVYSRKWPLIPREELLWLSLMAATSVAMSLCMFIAVTLMPVSTVETISMTSAIICTTLLLSVFWNERITIISLTAAVLCISGVVLVIQPECIFTKDVGETNHSHEHHHSTGSDVELGSQELMYSEGNNTGYENGSDITYNGLDQDPSSIEKDCIKYILPIVSGLAVSTSVLVMKRREFLRKEVITVLFWNLLATIGVSTVAMAIFETPVLPSSWFDAAMVTTNSVVFLLIWPMGMIAVRYINGNTYAILSSTGVVFLLIPQYTVLSSIHPGHRNWMEVGGVLLVLFGSVLGSCLDLVKTEK